MSRSRQGVVVSYLTPQADEGGGLYQIHFKCFTRKSMTVSVCVYIHSLIELLRPIFFFALFALFCRGLGLSVYHTCCKYWVAKKQQWFHWDVVIFRHVLGKRDPIAMAVRRQRHVSHTYIIKSSSWSAHYSFFD